MVVVDVSEGGRGFDADAEVLVLVSVVCFPLRKGRKGCRRREQEKKGRQENCCTKAGTAGTAGRIGIYLRRWVVIGGKADFLVGGGVSFISL